MGSRTHKVTLNFGTMAQVDVPQGRNGKHKEIVLRVLSDLEKVPAGTALKIPLAELAESKEKVRSALNRAIHKTRRDVATASDEEYLYVWNKAR
jgi:DNA helicase TIP49 (TBP-interacting protein)